MSGRRLILLMSVSMDGFARRTRPDDQLAGPPAPADEQVTALRNVLKAPPQLVFRLYTEAEHLSAGRSTPPRDVIDKLDLRVGRRYRYKVHSSIAARRALSPAERRAYERQAELVASLQKGASPVSKQSCCGPSSRTPEHR